jgi:epoxyqueuosine reductase
VVSDNPTRKRTRKVSGPLPSGPEYWEQLQRIGRENGLDAVGVAPAAPMERARQAIQSRIADGLVNEMQFTFRNPTRSTTPRMSVEGARSIIVGVRSYARDVDLHLDHQNELDHHNESFSLARVARYAWADHNEGLKQSLSAVMRKLRDDGHRAVIFADDNSIVDRETAYLAGIGWYGKNANILLPSAGSFFVIGCVVTTADLPIGTPLDDGCGPCMRCIPACPTQAISAPGVIDANKCLSWLLQKPGVFDHAYREALHDRIYGCDDCQTSCPQTVKKSVPVQISTSVSRVTLPARATIDIEWLLSATDDGVMSTCDHWYTHQRDPRWIRRNALIILGNIADPRSSRVRELVSQYVVHDDAILRAHAVWTAARLGYDDLVNIARDDHDPMVQDEIANLPTVRSDT